MRLYVIFCKSCLAEIEGAHHMGRLELSPIVNNSTKVLLVLRKPPSLTPLYFLIRYLEIPVVSRMYLTGAFLTTAACAVDLVTPFSLYFNWDLIFKEGQAWRLVTSFLFFGAFSVDFVFHMYFLVRTTLEYIRVQSYCSFRVFLYLCSGGGLVYAQRTHAHNRFPRPFASLNNDAHSCGIVGY